MLTKFNTSNPPAAEGNGGSSNSNSGGSALGWIIGLALVGVVTYVVVTAIKDQNKPWHSHLAADKDDKKNDVA